jgi:arsenate reductase (thioredoxin)
MKQRILFVCVHNAGRSQMAEALANHLAKERDLDVVAESAGSTGGKVINPLAIEVMKEIGVSMHGQTPKVITKSMVDEATHVISMGCGVDTESCPAPFIATDDWGLDDPAGQPIEKVREVRDEIKRRVDELLSIRLDQSDKIDK